MLRTNISNLIRRVDSIAEGTTEVTDVQMKLKLESDVCDVL